MRGVAYQPLGHESREISAPPVQAADVLVVFYWKSDPKESNDDKVIDGNKLLDKVYVSKAKCPSRFPKFERACRNDKPTLKQARRAFLEDFNAFMASKGVRIRLFKSCDEDQLFMRLSLHNEEVEAYYAEKDSYHLQIDRNAVKESGISYVSSNDPPDFPTPTEEETSPPYLPYSREFDKEQCKDLPKTAETNGGTIFKRYKLRRQEGSIFRMVDSIRMLCKIIGTSVNMDELIRSDIVIDWFPVHVQQPLDELKAEWANFFLHKLCHCFPSQPLDRIRNYFGEDTAFYFAWMGFTIRMFLLLALLGAIGKTCLILHVFGAEWTRGYVNLASGIIMAAWGTGYSLGWRRQEYSLRARWGMMTIAAREADRGGFRGSMLDSELNANEKRLSFPRWQAKFYKIVSAIVTMLFLMLVMACVSAVFYFRPLLVKKFGKMGITISSVAISVQIAAFNAIWSKVAVLLTKMENPRTQSLYNDSLIWKLFIFQFINSYNSFIYIAFFQRWRGNGCPNDDCVKFLQTSLYTTYGSLAAATIGSMLMPLLSLWWSLRSEKKALEEKLSKRGQTDIPKRCFMEKQVKMAPYDAETSIADTLNTMIAVGYVLIFCVVAPGVAFIALIVLLVQLRADSWKLCSVLKRPWPYEAAGLGAWNNVIDCLCWAGVMCSVGIPVVNLKVLDDYDEGDKMKIFFVCEHLLIFAKLMTTACINPEPLAVKVMIARREYAKNNIIMDKEEKEGFKKLDPPSLLDSDIAFLDESHAEWGEVDKMRGLPLIGDDGMGHLIGPAPTEDMLSLQREDYI